MKDIRINNDELLQFLQDLIKINSVNPSLSSKGAGEEEIAFFIGNFLKDLGLQVEYQSLDKNRFNVIGILKGNGGKSLMLNGHTDTVSIDGMEIKPFEPILKEGKVYGRGAYDMKGGVAAMIMAVKSIIEVGVKLNGDVILACVADEEYASIGTEALVKEYSADAAIITEPSELNITIAHKGFAWTKVEVFGKAAHGSLPDKGIDAIVKAGKVLTEIDNLGKTRLPQKKHPLLGSPSIHASFINGGKEISTYPDYCKIELERRILPGEDRKTIDEEIRQLIETIKSGDDQFNADYDVYFYRPPLEVSKEEAIVQCLSNAYQSLFKKKPEYTAVSGWMDSAILADAGIPTVIFGPAGEGAHAAVEYIDLDSVITSTKVLAAAIIDFCK
jgi:acetylornithine deacetylase